MRQPEHSTYLEWISVDLDGELQTRQKSLLREHLISCRSCREEQAYVRALDSKLAESRLEVDGEFKSDVMAALPTVGWESSHPKSWIAALAMVLLLGTAAAAVMGSTAARLEPAAPFLAALVAVFELFRSSVLAGAGLLTASWTGLGVVLESALESSTWNLVAFGVLVLGLNVFLLRLIRRRPQGQAAASTRHSRKT